MSPTEAMNAAAVCRLTPGTVMSRRMSGELSACAPGPPPAPEADRKEVDLAQASLERELVAGAAMNNVGLEAHWL
jgi:hypothetical protein